MVLLLQLVLWLAAVKIPEITITHHESGSAEIYGRPELSCGINSFDLIKNEPMMYKQYTDINISNNGLFAVFGWEL